MRTFIYLLEKFPRECVVVFKYSSHDQRSSHSRIYSDSSRYVKTFFDVSPWRNSRPPQNLLVWNYRTIRWIVTTNLMQLSNGSPITVLLLQRRWGKYFLLFEGIRFSRLHTVAYMIILLLIDITSFYILIIFFSDVGLSMTLPVLMTTVT